MRFRAITVAGASASVFSLFVGCSLLSLEGLSDGGDSDRDADPNNKLDGDAGDASTGGGGDDATTDVFDAADGDENLVNPPPLFADDFERADLLGPWEEVDRSTDSTIETTSSVGAHGGSRALRIALAPANLEKATHQKPIATPLLASAHFRYSFWLRFGAAPNRGANLPGFTFVDPVSVAIFATSNVSGDIDIAVQKGSYFFSSGAMPAPVNRWFSVVIECDAKANTYSASIDGRVRVPVRAIGVPTSPTTLILRSGSTYATAGPALEYFVDDVRLDALP